MHSMSDKLFEKSPGLIDLPINTKRLRIRRFEAQDLDAFCAYRADPEVGRYQGWHPFSLEQGRAFITEQQIGSLENIGCWFQIAVARRPANTIIGDIGLCMVSPNEAEIGFSFAREAQGMGYATEAVSALLQKLLRSGDVRSVRASSDARNDRSIALLERLGFVLKHSCDEIFHGQWCQQHHFRLEARNLM